MIQFSREITFLDNIIFIDGTSGAGKSAINSIIPCFNNVEIPIWDAFYESLSLLHEEKKIDTNSAKALMGTFAEMRLYDTLVGRHTNFRYKDGSSIFHNPNPLVNIKRIFKPDGDIVIENIKKEDSILTIGTHHLLSFVSLVFYTFRDKLKIIEMIRHPSSVILFWLEKNWSQRTGSDPREFTLAIKHDDKTLPWYAVGNETKFIEMNNIERTINALNWINKKREFQLKIFNGNQDKYVLTIPFEHFVTDPIIYIDTISKFISKDRTSNIKRFLRKANIPRRPETEVINRQTQKILKMKMNNSTKKIFETMCRDYNEMLSTLMSQL